MASGAASWLLDRSPTGVVADLSPWLVVVPGRRASRSLLGALVDEAAERGAALVPPTIVTPGDAPDALLGGAPRPLGALARALAWMDTLARAPARDLEPVAPSAPDRSDIMGLRTLARTVMAYADELAGEGLRFEDVAERCRRDARLGDTERWEALARLQGDYESALREAGHADPALARLDAVGRGKEPAWRGPVALAGVLDLGAVLRRAVASCAERAAALVFAPDSLKDRYDAFGRPDPEAWEDADAGLRDDQIVFADGPEDQTLAALEWIAEFAPESAPDDVVIGVGDDATGRFVERVIAERSGLTGRAATGAPLSASGPCRVLGAVAAYLDREDFESLATLVREPAARPELARRLGAGADLDRMIAALDRYRAETFPRAASGALPGRGGAHDGAQALVDAVRSWLDPALRAGRSPAPPSGLVGPIARVLGAPYAGVALRDADPAERAARRALSEIASALRTLSESRMALAAPDAMRLINAEVGARGAPEPGRPDAVEILGWLELAPDPAGSLVFVGFNEGAVPRSQASDPLLPDAARARLGLPDDRRRVARDSAALASVIGSKRRAVFVVGRRDAEGGPALPSRLIFRGPEERVVRRAARFGDARRDPSRTTVIAPTAPAGGEDRFPVAPLAGLPEPIRSMRVTSFRAYLRSPYAFYLEHALRLESVEDDARELDAMGFGTLLHNALDRFANSEARASTDADRIGAWLRDDLDRAVRERFGEDTPTALRVQLRFAGEWVSSFARWQAGRTGDGWRIVRSEWAPAPDDPGAALIVDGEPMGLRGKIDRIDAHDTRGVELLDYKTGLRVERPDKTHRSRTRGWTDLQLPLYRLLSRSLLDELGSERVGLGYVGRDQRGAVGGLMATWTDEDLESADEAARGVVRTVRAGAFGDVGHHAPKTGVLGALCGSGFLTLPDDDAAPEDEP